MDQQRLLGVFGCVLTAHDAFTVHSVVVYSVTHYLGVSHVAIWSWLSIRLFNDAWEQKLLLLYDRHFLSRVLELEAR